MRFPPHALSVELFTVFIGTFAAIPARLALAEPQSEAESRPDPEASAEANGVLRGMVLGADRRRCQVTLRLAEAPAIEAAGTGETALIPADAAAFADDGADADVAIEPDPPSTQSVQTQPLGPYSFAQVPPGSYDVIAICDYGQRIGLAKGVEVAVGAIAEMDVEVVPLNPVASVRDEPITSTRQSASSGELIMDSRDRTEDEISSTTGSTVTTVLDFISTDSFLGGEALDLTDAALFRLSSTRNLGELRIGAGIDLLAKQPPMGADLPFQGASLGARYRLSDSWAAGLNNSGGPLLGKLGWYGASELHVFGRKNLDRRLYFMGTAGTRGTALFPDAAGKKPWLLEGLIRGEVVLRERDIAAVWVGSTYGIPLAHSRGAEAMPGAGALDPQIRLSLHMGFTLSWIDSWDLFVDAALVDRGEASAPDTMLPIFDGGFDQSRLVLGITYRFDDSEDPSTPLELAY